MTAHHRLPKRDQRLRTALIPTSPQPIGCRCCYLPLGFGIKIGAMDINRFTEKAQEAIRSAQSKAVRYGQQQIDVEHLLAALLEQEGGLAASILLKAGVN